jgi:hypothetical protein
MYLCVYVSIGEDVLSAIEKVYTFRGIYLYIYVSIHLSIYTSMGLIIYVYMYQSMYLSIGIPSRDIVVSNCGLLGIYLSISISIYLIVVY